MKKINNIIILPIRCILFVFSFYTLKLITGYEYENLSKYWSLVCSACNIITIAFLIKLCKREDITYKQLIHYKKGNTKCSQVFLAIVLFFVIGMGGMYLAGLIIYGKIPYISIIMIQPIWLWLAILNAFVLPITTTLAEDGLYLGYCSNRIENHAAAIIIPAFFYALQHSFIPFLMDGKFIMYRFLSFFPLTLIMLIWYRKSRNPLHLMIGHFTLNIATVGQIIMTSALPNFKY